MRTSDRTGKSKSRSSDRPTGRTTSAASTTPKRRRARRGSKARRRREGGADVEDQDRRRKRRKHIIKIGEGKRMLKRQKKRRTRRKRGTGKQRRTRGNRRRERRGYKRIIKTVQNNKLQLPKPRAAQSTRHPRPTYSVALCCMEPRTFPNGTKDMLLRVYPIQSEPQQSATIFD